MDRFVVFLTVGFKGKEPLKRNSRSLSNEEVNHLQNQVVMRLKEEFGVEIR